MKLLEAFTGDDNVTLEPAYFWTGLVVLTALVLQSYVTIKTGVFDLQQFGIGMASILGGGAAYAKLGK